MAKCTPKVEIRELRVVETIENQTGITLELSNVEAHVIARLLGNIGGSYDTQDPGCLRSITSRLWSALVEARYGTEAHLRDGTTWFEPAHSFLVSADKARPADIAPGVSL